MPKSDFKRVVVIVTQKDFTRIQIDNYLIDTWHMSHSHSFSIISRTKHTLIHIVRESEGIILFSFSFCERTKSHLLDAIFDQMYPWIISQHQSSIWRSIIIIFNCAFESNSLDRRSKCSSHC